MRIAARGHPRLMAVVLVASFVRSPLSRWLSALRWLIGSWCFRFPLPAWAIRRLLAGGDAPHELITAVRSAVATVAPYVMAKRLRAVLEVDGRSLLSLSRVPVLSICGNQDRLVSPHNSDDLRALGERLENVILEAPHLVLQRQPAAAAHVIGEFLRTKVPAIGT
jgi:pimeloyl-ACP methyl ester carboxylesterase